MERIGIYGGSFNPPHVGHLRAAKFALEAFGLDRLLLIPSNISSHKARPANSPTAKQRLEMLRIATDGCEGLEVCDLELRRGGVSYTWQTLQALRGQYPDAEFLLFMGTDMFLGFDTWMHPERIIAEATLVVFDRDDKTDDLADQTEKLEQMGARVVFAHNPVTRLSSTDLRRLIAFGCAAPFLPEGVWDYIRQRGLYGAGKTHRRRSIPQLEKIVCSLLKPDRVDHVLGCRETAAQLARLWGANEKDAQRAALLHDITKALDGPMQLALCAEYGVQLDDFSQANPKTLHALTGSLVAQRIFGEKPAVVAAIRSHTTGKADMNTLEKIIYVADYMEPNRSFVGVKRLRILAYTDLDEALKRGLVMTLSMLKKQGRQISPESQQALAWLNRPQ